MFNFPRYELDEGTYISNAWAITQGLISPYPYGYGHPPLAWMQIAAWMQLTGGPFTFGNALNSGRVFMLFYAVGSALLVYLIVRRWSGSRSAALSRPGSAGRSAPGRPRGRRSHPAWRRGRRPRAPR